MSAHPAVFHFSDDRSIGVQLERRAEASAPFIPGDVAQVGKMLCPGEAADDIRLADSAEGNSQLRREIARIHGNFIFFRRIVGSPLIMIKPVAYPEIAPALDPDADEGRHAGKPRSVRAVFENAVARFSDAAHDEGNLLGEALRGKKRRGKNENRSEAPHQTSTR